MSNDERAQFEEFRWHDGGLLRRDHDAGVKVPLLADNTEKGVGELRGVTIIVQVLDI